MGKIKIKRLMQKNSQFRHGNNGKFNSEVKKKPRFFRGIASQSAAQHAKMIDARTALFLGSFSVTKKKLSMSTYKTDKSISF